MHIINRKSKTGEMATHFSTSDIGVRGIADVGTGLGAGVPEVPCPKRSADINIAISDRKKVNDFIGISFDG
ncbi:hypothetical protein CRS_07160 [Chryseobacterium sp. ON_d1]|nr:hypothetical protein CRS_07160 [Chryseobacterium sp. ON_d1]